MKPQNKEVDFTFYPTKDFKECPVCGICSFPHIHRKGTLPKDFERIEPENKSTNEEKCKHIFPWGESCIKCGEKNPACGVSDLMLGKSTNGEWEKVLGKFEIKIEDGFFSGCTVYHSAVYEFIKDKLSQAEEKGYQRGLKEKFGEIRVAIEVIEREKAEAIQKRNEEIKEWVDNYDTTRGVEHSDSYQIGQNHGRQEFKKDALNFLTTNK